MGLIATVIAISARKLGDFDLPWHLAFGRIVVHTKTIPRIDDLAYTHRPIQYAEFLADAGLYGLIRLAGPFGLQLLGGLLALLALWILSRRDPASPADLWLGSFSIAAASAWWIVRPATLSFVFIAWTATCLELHRAHPRSKAARWCFASLIPVHLLWANLHGFVVIGLVLIAAYMAYRVGCSVLHARFPRFFPATDANEWKETCVVGGSVWLVSLINMAGFNLLAAPFRALPDVGRVTEWEPTTLRFLLTQEPVALLYAVLVLVLLVGGASPPKTHRLPSAWDCLVILLGIILASSAVRLLAVAAMMTAPIAARRLAGILPKTNMIWMTASASPWLLALWILLRPGTSFGIGFEPDHFPEPAVQFIQSHPLQGKMWNSSVYGGYFSWRLYPEHRILMDGRTAWVHEPRLIELASKSERSTEAFQQLHREFHFEWAICRAFENEAFGLPLAQDNSFAMVFWDDVSAIYVRRDGLNHELSESGYKLVRHLTPLTDLLALAVQGKRGLELEHDAQLACQQAPLSARAAFVEACAAMALRNASAFEQALARLQRLSHHPEPVTLLENAWNHVR
ncbi:MAG: hypothetical protein BWY17_04213 [Deltaproteobacteria bacterium ADurb.Bin207]|nr:MAG: hypothetical protein BWY17_04213 [Deltaproteobacteria bacterium ADurb.Bin207]